LLNIYRYFKVRGKIKWFLLLYLVIMKKKQ
jgi:hypothetical protein